MTAMLPEHTAAAVALYLCDVGRLGWAADLAGVTRWALLDELQARSVMQRPGNARSANVIDDLAERLERRGILETLCATTS